MNTKIKFLFIILLAVTTIFTLQDVNATVTYGETIGLNYIYRYNSSDGTYSANYGSSSSWTWFPSPQVGDMIYFGNPVNQGGSPYFDDINEFKISQPMVCANLSWVYEIYTGSWTPVDVVDGTNNFSQNGTINTSMQGYVGQVSINGVNGYWNRIRLTEVNCSQSAEIVSRVYFGDNQFNINASHSWDDVLSADSQNMCSGYENGYGCIAGVHIKNGGTLSITEDHVYFRRMWDVDTGGTATVTRGAVMVYGTGIAPYYSYTDYDGTLNLVESMWHDETATRFTDSDGLDCDRCYIRFRYGNFMGTSNSDYYFMNLAPESEDWYVNGNNDMDTLDLGGNGVDIRPPNYWTTVYAYRLKNVANFDVTLYSGSYYNSYVRDSDYCDTVTFGGSTPNKRLYQQRSFTLRIYNETNEPLDADIWLKSESQGTTAFQTTTGADGYYSTYVTYKLDDSSASDPNYNNFWLFVNATGYMDINITDINLTDDAVDWKIKMQPTTFKSIKIKPTGYLDVVID